MMNAVNIGKSDPLSAGSIFKNPAAEELERIEGLTSRLRAVLPAPIDPLEADPLDSYTDAMESFTSLVNGNTADKLSSISRTMRIAVSYQAMKNSIYAADGVALPGGACNFVDRLFRSINEVGDLISETLNQIMADIQAAVGSVINFAEATIAEIRAIASDVMDAAQGAMAAVVATIEAAMNTLRSWIAEEAVLLERMVAELLDFSFLKGLGGFGPYGNAIMDKVIDGSKLDTERLATL
jgi:hypothetical protein